MRYLVFMLSWLASASVFGACLQPGMLKGVNLSGPEFNAAAIPGVVNKDYVYPTATEFEYFSRTGMNTVRLPFLWERLQPVLFRALDDAELSRIKATAALAQAHDMCLILDLHSYGSYRGKAIKAEEVGSAAFIDLWQKIARAFPYPERVAFGLSNEPYTLSIAQWAEIAQQTVSQLRAKGAGNLILVSGGRWSGLHEWEKTFDGLSNAAAFAHFRDPLQRTAIEVHQYADANFSGTGKTCLPAAQFQSLFDTAAAWAKAHKQILFMGEFGVPANEPCLAALDMMLNNMRDTSVWRGWTYWAAGSWWGDYPLSIAPRKGEDAPQMRIIRRYL